MSRDEFALTVPDDDFALSQAQRFAGTVTGLAGPRRSAGVRGERGEYTNQLVVLPAWVCDRHDHAGHKQLDAILGIDAERRQPMTKLRSFLAPPARGFSLLDVVPLAAVGVVVDMAAKTLRCPLAMAGGALQSLVVRIVRMKLRIEAWGS